MKEITFITSNEGKAKNLAKYLGYPVKHTKIELDEIQSLDPRVVIEHKLRQAYKIAKIPMIVDDISLEFMALKRLPGTYIRSFLDELGLQGLCDLAEATGRQAIGRSHIGFYDGETMQIFSGELKGTIATKPAGDKGFGWDSIFIPDGYTVTRAELDEVDYEKIYKTLRPLDELKAYLETL